MEKVLDSFVQFEIVYRPYKDSYKMRCRFCELSQSRPICFEEENNMRVPEIYGSLVFNDSVMRTKLPKDIYKSLKKTIENNTHLELDVANAVAVAMKEWAVEHGATHYTHWFQPLTGSTAGVFFN